MAYIPIIGSMLKEVVRHRPDAPLLVQASRDADLLSQEIQNVATGNPQHCVHEDGLLCRCAEKHQQISLTFQGVV